ncbi:MAG: ATP-binding cassette domain-containing protein [Cyanobacteriota bacterium]
MLSFDGVEVTYPSGSQALKGISLDIPKGQFVVIVGLSGVGKSTLIRTINNLVVLSKGEIRMGGRSITRARGAELHKMWAAIGQLLRTYLSFFDYRGTAVLILIVFGVVLLINAVSSYARSKLI